MRALTALTLIVLAFAPLACKRQRSALETGAQGPPELASIVHVRDPRMAEQLINGFYDIEARAWRWTGRQFTVVLRSPAGSGQNGASLQVHLTVPPVIIEKLTQITLTPTIRGTKLDPETYSKPGDYVYQHDVPASLFTSPSVRVEFQLDKAMPPTAADARELGVIVSSIGLALK